MENEKGDCKTKCLFCDTNMVWGADFSFEDYGMEGDGIVITLICPNCNASAEFYTKI